MHARNPRETYRGHAIAWEDDGWWQIQSPAMDGDPLVLVGGFGEPGQARASARSFVDAVTRVPNPRRLPNIIVRKREAEYLLRKPLKGRKTDYYVLSEPKNLGGPYSSMKAAKKRLAQVEYFKRVKPGRRNNPRTVQGRRYPTADEMRARVWAGGPGGLTAEGAEILDDLGILQGGRCPNWTSPDEASEYAIKRWGHEYYLDVGPERARRTTWAEFADWIRKTGDLDAQRAAAAVEGRSGLMQDFPVPVDPFRNPGPLEWTEQRRYTRNLAPGDHQSADLVPGLYYELRCRGLWEIWLRHYDEVMPVGTEQDVEAAKGAAALDARELFLFACEIGQSPAPNPKEQWDLQTVIVDKSVAPSREAATDIAREFAKRIYTSRETSTSYRFRQRPPGDFVKKSFRTRQIPGMGVSLVYGRLARGAKPPGKRRKAR